MNIEEIEGREFNVMVDVMGDKFAVTYKPYNMSTKDVYGTSAEENPQEAFINQCLITISLWDLQDADGVMVPITKERLELMPIRLLTIVMVAINNDQMARQDDACQRMFAEQRGELPPQAEEQVSRLLGEDHDDI